MSEHDKSTGPLEDAKVASRGKSRSTSPTKTPMYQAFHSSRYGRQALLRSIRERFGTPLICYMSGIAALISRDDTVFLVDLLHNLQRGCDLDLLLHTPGGDIDAAEKLILMLQTWVGKARLRVIVPDFAKSAGTLMALGSDRIVMSDASELGPIDPQVILNDGRGNRIAHSVQTYLDAYEQYAASLHKDPNDAVAKMMLSKLDPATLKLFEAVRDRARTLAEQLLNRGMFRTKAGNFTEIAGRLIDTKKWLAHGQMISYQDAKSMGLNIEYLAFSSEEWQAYWSVYCLQRLAVKDGEKLFESEYASLQTDSSK